MTFSRIEKSHDFTQRSPGNGGSTPLPGLPHDKMLQPTLHKPTVITEPIVCLRACIQCIFVFNDAIVRLQVFYPYRFRAF
jgi:hypothetical protein